MVLAELGSQINGAFRKLFSATIIDDAIIEDVIKDIVRSLLMADVNVRYVRQLQENVKKAVYQDNEIVGANRRKYIQKIIFSEIVSLMTAKRKAYVPKKGSKNVIMFVGLQGAGKTTTCTKFGHYYQRKGWRTGLICADTFRAGAFDQLKQNATKAKIPFYGSYTEADPVKVARDGVNKFKNEKYDLIIVDTSGRHKQEESLFEEMKQISKAIEPDDIVFVMDSHIGQACYDQALAFCSAVDVGSVIITKLDGHAKGGGAISAVSATNSPIIFIGTGEHFDDFEPFDSQSFVSRLLGFGDINGLINTFKEVVENNTKLDSIERISKGKFTLRDMYDQFQNVMKMGPMGQVMSMIPGITPNLIGKGMEQEGIARIKRFMVIMDSMTDEELDCEKQLNESRFNRIARGSGSSHSEIKTLLEQHKLLHKMVGRMSKMGLNKESAMQSVMRNPQQIASKMQNIMDPRLLKQMGGASNLVNIFKEVLDKLTKFSQREDIQALMKHQHHQRKK